MATTGIINFADLITVNNGAMRPIVDEVIQNSPELSLIPAEKISGTSVDVSVRTDVVSGGFRNVNEGVTVGKSKWESRNFQLHVLDYQMQMDEAAVRRAVRRDQLMAGEVESAMQSLAADVGSQFYYGATADAKGFPGLIAQSKGLTTGDNADVIDATGTTAGQKTSVFFVRINPRTLHFITGPDGISDAKEWRLSDVRSGSGATTSKFTAWVNNVGGDVGFMLENKYSVVRIKQITQDSGKGMTDDLAFKAFRQFQINNNGMKPTHILAHPMSIYQWSTGRTNTGSNTKGQPADWMSDWFGIPIVPTTSILLGESI